MYALWKHVKSAIYGEVVYDLWPHEHLLHRVHSACLILPHGRASTEQEGPGKPLALQSHTFLCSCIVKATLHLALTWLTLAALRAFQFGVYAVEPMGGERPTASLQPCCEPGTLPRSGDSTGYSDGLATGPRLWRKKDIWMLVMNIGVWPFIIGLKFCQIDESWAGLVYIFCSFLGPRSCSVILWTILF